MLRERRMAAHWQKDLQWNPSPGQDTHDTAVQDRKKPAETPFYWPGHLRSFPLLANCSLLNEPNPQPQPVPSQSSLLRIALIFPPKQAGQRHPPWGSQKHSEVSEPRTRLSRSAVLAAGTRRPQRGLARGHCCTTLPVNPGFLCGQGPEFADPYGLHRLSSRTPGKHSILIAAFPATLT